MTISLYIIIIVFMLYVIVLVVAGTIDYSEFKEGIIETTRVISNITKIEDWKKRKLNK